MDKVLRNYLEDVRVLENKKYILSKTLQELEDSKLPVPYLQAGYIPLEGNDPDVNHSSLYGYEVVNTYFWRDKFEDGTYCSVLQIDFGHDVFEEERRSRELRKYRSEGTVFVDSMCSYSKPREPVYKSEQFDIFGKVRKENLKLRRDYEDYVVQWKNRRAWEKATFEKQYANSRKFDAIVRHSIAENSTLPGQIEVVTEQLKEVSDLLDKIYSENIVHPKYRGLVPITMFCEYMDTGRRDKLAGKGEMYDLYESELAAKTICRSLDEINGHLVEISHKLDSINSKLGAIISNQYMLYHAVQTSNDTTNSILSELGEQRKQMAESMSKINSVASSMAESIGEIKFTASNIAKTQEIVASRSSKAIDQQAIMLHIMRHNWDY